MGGILLCGCLGKHFCTAEDVERDMDNRRSIAKYCDIKIEQDEAKPALLVTISHTGTTDDKPFYVFAKNEYPYWSNFLVFKNGEAVSDVPRILFWGYPDHPAIASYICVKPGGKHRFNLRLDRKRIKDVFKEIARYETAPTKVINSI